MPIAKKSLRIIVNHKNNNNYYLSSHNVLHYNPSLLNIQCSQNIEQVSVVNGYKG